MPPDPQGPPLLVGDRTIVRPLLAGEREPVLSVFSGLSPASRASRFLTGVARLPEPIVRALVDLEHGRHEAWLASVDGVAVGIVRYVRLDEVTAEFAVAVIDRVQGNGVGRALLDTAARAAFARGLRRFRGTVEPANERMLRLLSRQGVRIERVGPVLEAEGDLPHPTLCPGSPSITRRV